MQRAGGAPALVPACVTLAADLCRLPNLRPGPKALVHLAELPASSVWMPAVHPHAQVVVHCWGGGGRTGVALAAWLVRHHGLTPAAAAEQVESYAKAQGASRRADVSQLQGFLGASA